MSDGRASTGEGKRFGRYQVIEPLGSGAMGAVYRAHDDILARHVAIKTIHVGGLSGFRAEMFHRRFANEARAIAALSHPNVVDVFDVGVQDGTPFLVMEVVEGRSLAARLEAGPLGPDAARGLGRQIAGALQAAHTRGIVHRDVKPANILEAEPGRWKLADFGVAHIPDSSLTITGQFLGSPAYAAPEALERGEFGAPSDVYGLGATLYEAVSGSPPFGAGGLLTVGALASGSEARAITEVCPALPADLAVAITGMLTRDPARRPGAAEVAMILSGVRSERQLRPAASAVDVAAWRRRKTLAIGGGVLALLAAGILIGAGASSGGDGSAPAPPLGSQPSNTPASTLVSGAGYSSPVAADPRMDAKRAKRWRKVQEKLREGDYRDAEKELGKILRDNPADSQARELLERLRSVRHQQRNGREDED